jgi:hypothetical protein
MNIKRKYETTEVAEKFSAFSKRILLKTDSQKDNTLLCSLSSFHVSKYEESQVRTYLRAPNKGAGV